MALGTFDSLKNVLRYSFCLKSSHMTRTAGKHAVHSVYYITLSVDTCIYLIPATVMHMMFARGCDLPLLSSAGNMPLMITSGPAMGPGMAPGMVPGMVPPAMVQQPGGYY